MRTPWIELAAAVLVACNDDTAVPPAPDPPDDPGPDADLTVVAQPIGAPTWTPVDFQLFSAPLPASGYPEVLRCLLDPARHKYSSEHDVWRPGEAHDAPYGTEVSDGVTACGHQSTRLYDASAITDPNALFFVFMLVPGDDAPSGRSIDAELAPILPSTTFPITFKVNFLHDGQLVDVIDDGRYPRMDELNVSGDGMSHAPLFFWEALSLLPPNTQPTGTFTWQITLTDSRSAGWSIHTNVLLQEEEDGE